MKELIRKTQQKIYAIWRKAKQHISSFVGGQFKGRQKGKNEYITIMEKIKNLLSCGFQLKKEALIAFEYIPYNTTDDEHLKLQRRINAYIQKVIKLTEELDFNWASLSISNITNAYFDDEIQINSAKDVEFYFSKILEILLEEEKFLENRYKEKNAVSVITIDNIDNINKNLSPFDDNDSKYLNSAFYEIDIKSEFIKIFNIVYTQNDSPSELCDLYSNDIKINGLRYETAIMLKGKSLKKPMTVANSDKNGTQLVRLTRNSACSLYIVQHVNEITQEFKIMLTDYLRVYSKFLGVKVCFIDGKDTIRLLRAFNVDIDELSKRIDPLKR